MWSWFAFIFAFLFYSLFKEKIMTYTAIIKQVPEGWIGWMEEIPGVNCQEQTYEALVETLAITAREAILLNKEEALASAGSGYRELSLTV